MQAVSSITSEDEGKTYEVPETCIGNAKDARETITSLVKAEETRSKKRSKVNGLVNGNPPYPPAELTRVGQSDRANFTQREAEGFIAAAKTPYYALAFKPPRFVQLTLDYGQADPALLAGWAGKIATRYQYANEDDDTLDMHMQRSQFQMVLHGSGPMVWEDSTDWKATSRMAGQILVLDDASADIDEWDTAACPRSYLPSVLWKKIKNEKAATDMGWNVEAVKRAIMKAAPEHATKTLGNSWEFYEAELRKSVTGWDAKSKRILVYDLFQKEFSGKISKFILLREDEGNTESFPTGDKPGDPLCGFLFRKIDKIDCWSQIICPFLYDVGPDGQWHSVKGAGPKIFDFCSASDRLMMAMLDGSMKASGVCLKAKDMKSLQQTAITPMTGAYVVGPDYEVIQQRIAPDMQSPLLAKRDLGDTLSRNTGQYRAHFVTDDHAPTLGQEQMTAAEQNVLADGDASRYCKQLDRFHRERFRRMLAMGKKLYAKRKGVAPVESDKERSLTSSEQIALKMYKGCVETDGIPEEILAFENFCRIKASRLVGNGSAQMRQVVGSQLMQLLPMAPERGRNFILRNQVSALADEAYADAIFPSYDTPQVVDSHMSLAALENNFLKIPGSTLLVDGSQDHITHFGIHLKSVGEHAQQVQQGGADPRALLIHLEQAGPHMHQHLVAVQGDPTRKGQVEGMVESFQEMSAMADQLAQQIAEADKAAEAQQPPQAPDPAIITGLAKVHADYEVKREAMLLKHSLRAQDQKFKQRQKDATTAHGMRLENLKALQGVAA